MTSTVDLIPGITCAGECFADIVGGDIHAPLVEVQAAAEVEKADQADAAYAAAQQQAAALVAEAGAEARRTIEAAKAAAHDEREAGLDQAEQGARAILLQAEQAIEAEKVKVTGEASEELVTLITQVARRFIEESLSENERRAVTQKLILSSLKELEGAASRP